MIVVLNDMPNLSIPKNMPMSRRDDRPSKCHASTPEIIEILDSSDEEPMVIKMEEKYKPQSDPSSNPQVETEDPPKDASGRIIVTRKMKVDAVKYLPAVLTHWPVPAVDTAYVLDFSEDVPGNSETKKGKPKGLDAFLKAEVRVNSNEAISNENPDLAEGSRLLGKRDERQYNARSKVDTLE
jgi:hypothetical protein